MPKLRPGRKQPQNLYFQIGEEPGDNDTYIGVIFDPANAGIIISMVNGDHPLMNEWSGSLNANPKETA